MFKLCTTALAIILLTGIGYGVMTASTAHALHWQDGAVDQFGGRFVYIIESDLETATCLVDPRTAEMGGRTFIVGRSIDPVGDVDWRRGATVWVPLESVMQMVAFTDRETLEERFRRAGF